MILEYMGYPLNSLTRAQRVLTRNAHMHDDFRSASYGVWQRDG